MIGSFDTDVPSGGVQFNGSQFIDLNGDGLIDFVDGSGGIGRLALNNGTSMSGDQTTHFLPDRLMRAFPSTDGAAQAMLADVDGDGLPDYIQNVTAGSDSGVWLNRPQSATGWEKSTTFRNIARDFGRTGKPDRMADVNGDGLADLIVWGFEGSSNPGDGELVYLSNGSDWVTSQLGQRVLRLSDGSTSGPFASNQYLFPSGVTFANDHLEDINRDGLLDLVETHPSSGVWHAWINTGDISTGHHELISYYDNSGTLAGDWDYATMWKESTFQVYTGAAEAPEHQFVGDLVCSVGGGPTFQYDAAGNLTGGSGRDITYNTSNKVISIYSHPSTSLGHDTGEVDFVYNADGNRAVQTVRATPGGAPLASTVYVGLGATGKSLYERTTRGDGTKEHSLFLFAGGHHGGSAVAVKVVTQVGTSLTPAMKYFHTDHLGSVTAVSDDYGRVLDPTWGANAATLMDYDAWGARRNPDGTAASSPAVFDQPVGNRGFTGHEAIPDVGLVNMNGRAYDPGIGRFLSPDPNVQFAANLQSYNRYSYVLNNPLSLTDPTGYFSLSSLGAFNILLGVAGTVACGGNFGCGLALAAFSATINTVAMAQSGMAWDQAIAVNLLGLAGSMAGGIIGGPIGGGTAVGLGAIANGSVATLSAQVVGGVIGGMMGATFAAAASGQSITGEGLLSAAFQGAMWAAVSWGFAQIAPVTQGSDQGGSGSGAKKLEGYLVACQGDCDVGPKPITKSFSIDQVKGAGDVRGELFIQADTVADLQGDGRGFDPGPNPAHSRVFFDLDFENGRGTIQVNPSCSAGGGCVDALPWGKGNSVQIQTAGGRVSIAGSFTNSIHTNGPSIDFGIQVFARSGGVSFFGSRDPYPSFELTRTSSAGTQVLLNSPETNPICLTGVCGMDRFSGASR